MNGPIVGSTIISRITVTDPVTGELTDADSVDLVVQDPAGVEMVEAPTHPSTGIYEFPIPLTAEGWWIAIWTVTVGDLVTVEECQVCAIATSLSSSPASP